jgi:hypothetical protein
MQHLLLFITFRSLMHNNTKRAGNTSQPDTLTIARWGEMGRENGGIDGGAASFTTSADIKEPSQQPRVGGWRGFVFGAGETTTACDGF